MLAKADTQFFRAIHTEHYPSLDKLMACVRNKSLVSAECIGEDLGANNREYMVLGGSEGRKIISNKNEPKQFKNGKQLTLETATNSRR